jgi:nucleoside-triphosphatase THEP1
MANAETGTGKSTLLAFIPFMQDDATDRVLEAVARQLIATGHRVEGFIQHAEKDEGQCCGAVDLEDIATGRRWQIMQALGAHARGCRLDFNALSEAAVFAEARIRTQPDLLILNRFGKGEEQGGGLRSVFEAAFMAGVPILTSVKQPYLDGWFAFSGDLSQALPPETDAVRQWSCDAIARARRVRDAA